jgi:phosphonate transport system permease protein
MLARTAIALGALGAASVAAIAVGGYDFGAILDAQERARAFERVGRFLGALGRPDLSAGFLQLCGTLAVQTLAIALGGTLLAMAGGSLLALCSSRRVLVGDARGARRAVLTALNETARLAQDVLRGIPDFAWALLLIPLLGLGTGAGVAALALNVAGILARVYSEMFDAVPERALEPLRAAGVGRLQALVYGILPHARTGLVSFTLLRWECAVRNASVLGVVGAGGLGSEILVRINYGEYEKVLTLLGCTLLLTVGSDLLSGFVRRRLDAGGASPAPTLAQARRRWAGLALVLGGLLAAALAVAVPDAVRDVSGSEVDWATRWQQTRDLYAGLFSPDWSVTGAALGSAAVPLSMAWLGTLLASCAAAAFAYGGSRRFQLGRAEFAGGRESAAARAAAWARLVVVRGLAIVARATPDVVWALLLVSFWRQGTLPGLLAIALHTFGLQLRLYVESVDALPVRRLEVVNAAAGSPRRTFLWAGVPSVLPEWLVNAFFQLEYNVRNAVVLGLIGAGGLGFHFSVNFEWFRFEKAAVYLLVMVALAFALDRLSRALGLARSRLSIT